MTMMILPSASKTPNVAEGISERASEFGRKNKKGLLLASVLAITALVFVVAAVLPSGSESGVAPSLPASSVESSTQADSAKPPETTARKPQLRSVSSTGPSSSPTQEPTESPTQEPTAPPSQEPTTSPSQEPTLSPYQKPTFNPTKEPTMPPTPRPTPIPPPALKRRPIETNADKFTIVIGSGGSLPRNRFVSSPNGAYSLGLSNSGDFVLKDNRSNQVVWNAGISNTNKLFMQPDGNVVARQGNNRANWSSETSRHHGGVLVVDNGGQAAVIHSNTRLWIAGVPRGHYTGPSSDNLKYPLRGAFYYPWYPETWSVGGKQVFYHPKLGKYSSGDPRAIADHVKALDYAHVDLAIASWWGPDEQLDRARITNLMDKTIEMGTGMKWTVYQEQEMTQNKGVSELRKDLAYLKKWFVWHKAWAHIDGRPVIFIYNDGGCNNVNRWMEAAAGEWYVIPKIFPKFFNCATQPDHWHEYAPHHAVDYKRGHSYTLSPGFWRADKKHPNLPRVDRGRWQQNVRDMVNSREDLQLITTFNEWGEGTAVESASEWNSGSGYGHYLDSLHNIH